MTEQTDKNMFWTCEDIQIVPVEKANWVDFETFFESKPLLSNCWCMAWRMTKDEMKTNNSACRKEFIKKRVWTNIPIGLLAYIGDQPIAWCSVAPRETYRKLGGDEDLDSVWSISCFYIKREFRDKGLICALIEHAKKYAKSNDAKYLEAYPVEFDSPSYRHMGFVQTFRKEGFVFVKKAGTRRNVMIYKL